MYIGFWQSISSPADGAVAMLAALAVSRSVRGSPSFVICLAFPGEWHQLQDKNLALRDSHFRRVGRYRCGFFLFVSLFLSIFPYLYFIFIFFLWFNLVILFYLFPPRDFCVRVKTVWHVYTKRALKMHISVLGEVQTQFGWPASNYHSKAAGHWSYELIYYLISAKQQTLRNYPALLLFILSLYCFFKQLGVTPHQLKWTWCGPLPTTVKCRLSCSLFPEESMDSRVQWGLLKVHQSLSLKKLVSYNNLNL